MQNVRLIMAVLMVFFISDVSSSSVFADDSEDLLDAACFGKNRVERVKLWFEKNADLLASGKGGATLFSAKDKDGWTALICAAANNDHRSAQLLIKAGAEINVQDNLGWTPLMYAADSKEIEMVRFLMKNGADVNAGNKEGLTSLMLAADDGVSEIIELLIDSGAKVNVKDNMGLTALNHATMGKHPDTAILLVKKGAKLDAKSVKFFLENDIDLKKLK